ncbi:hypothetical protein Q2T42_28910 [Leptolyngbya boryana CZ1]|uniref:Uncharacterized protein n=1 Tax=Leptolyngbya boryana CZ1 TaxID=3060204 RepID=A0AA96WX68_LEPBY|nr:hypothetical protein [Leptolyngbya boryana]WNZ45814.1 hypothetical protein Q2T42_28910 [Leptolyngbya boryana CZ1]
MAQTLSEAFKNSLIAAIDRTRNQITWKPGKAEPHLAKRIRLKHLPATSSLSDYESRIIHILNRLDASVYIYEFNEIIYPTVVAQVDSDIWLVMITMNGVLETAFPPDNPEEYLSNPNFSYVGQLGEL